jgi:hypothetical protein
VFRPRFETVASRIQVKRIAASANLTWLCLLRWLVGFCKVLRGFIDLAVRNIMRSGYGLTRIYFVGCAWVIKTKDHTSSLLPKCCWNHCPATSFSTSHLPLSAPQKPGITTRPVAVMYMAWIQADKPHSVLTSWKQIKYISRFRNGVQHEQVHIH